ncbi:MAG: hypothetical protein KY450_12580 [Actinobacteria bacterium]|nr:hypothetical protein [Actinomycetota bacterium]
MLSEEAALVQWAAAAADHSTTPPEAGEDAQAVATRAVAGDAGLTWWSGPAGAGNTSALAPPSTGSAPRDGRCSASHLR